MSMTKGTPASSQIIWLEDRVKQLEGELAAERKTSEAHRQRREDIAAECNHLRAELATERSAHERMWANWEATRLEYDRRLSIAEVDVAKLREALAELWDGSKHLAWPDEMDARIAELLSETRGDENE